MVKIFIDPGHGGKDSGAVGFGIQEKNIVLDISKRQERLLREYEGVEVRLSRTDDIYLTHQQRCQMANSWGADLLISNHNNGFSRESAHGFESFIHPVTPQRTKNYQSVIHENTLTEIRKIDSAIVDRGMKTANFAMLRLSDMSAILIEFLFITNRRNNDLLKREEFREACALGVVKGIAQLFQLQKKDSIQEEAYHTYTVVAGDTLSAIAQRFGTTVNELVRLNNISNPDRIRVGQIIQLPASTPATYTVVAGDTLSAIAKRFGTTVNELVRLNNISNPDRIRVGQVLKLR